MYVFQREDLPKWHDLSTSLQEILSHYVDYDQKYPYQDFGPNIKAFWNKVTAAIYGGTDYRTFTYPSGYKNIHQRLLDCETRCTNLEKRATRLEERMTNAEDLLNSFTPQISALATVANSHETTLSNHAARIAALEAKKECTCTHSGGGRGPEYIVIYAGMITYKTAGARTFIVPSGNRQVKAYCVGGGAGGTVSCGCGRPTTVGAVATSSRGGNGGTSYVQSSGGTISGGGAISGYLKCTCTGSVPYYYYYDQDGYEVRTGSPGFYDEYGSYHSYSIGYDLSLRYEAVESAPGSGNYQNGNKCPWTKMEGSTYNGYTWGHCHQRSNVTSAGATGRSIPNTDAVSVGGGGMAISDSPPSGSGGAYSGVDRNPSPRGVMVFGGASGGFSKGTLNVTPGEVLQIRIGGGGGGYKWTSGSHPGGPYATVYSGSSGAVVLTWGMDIVGIG